MPGRIESTSGVRESPVCIFRERAVPASSQICLAQAMMAGHRQRPCSTFRGRSSSVPRFIPPRGLSGLPQLWN